ncbi:MAG: hypothetical protein R3A79_24310 [Nannocystaceae bacterium]
MGVLAGCGEPARQPTVILAVDGLDDPGVALALDDVSADIEAITGERPRRGRSGRCREGQVRIEVVEPERAEATAELAGLGPQEFAIHERRCARGGRRLRLAGGSSLARQWAIYALMEELGVRYLHPEATLLPEALDWPELPLRLRDGPAIGRRTMHAHRRHPIELSPPLPGDGDGDDLDMAGHQRRWIDWSVKMRQTAVDGWDHALVGDYAARRGFPTVVGLNLANTQQGAAAALDPDDPRAEAEQLADAVDRAMTAAAALDPPLPAPTRLELQFNPSEFTEVDPRRTVARLRAIADYFERRYPEATIEAINHGTRGEPRPPYQRRFFDLPALAPASLGVEVHTLMFYDLERPAAGVYGNESYAPLLRFIREEQAKRRIVHYPESSWWLTFDLPVPLYLAPATIDARAYDLELLSPYLTADPQARSGVVGHHLFTSGQEWGYWMVDYCVAKMTWDPGLGFAGCVDSITGALAEGEALAEVLEAARSEQVETLREPRLLRLLVGSDDETEAGRALGIEVHPLPPTPAEVLAMDELAAAALAEDLERLAAIAGDYGRWADRVDATLAAQSDAQAPWVREIADGLRIVELRAAHAVAIYRGALALRGAGEASRALARRELDRARALTQAAREVVRRREEDYRYPPALTIAGDERGTADARPNRSVYPFRVLSRTHRLFYWERPDAQLAALVDVEPRWVAASASIVAAGEPLILEVAGGAGPQVAIQWGDGARSDAVEPHRYFAPGRYVWRASAAGDDEGGPRRSAEGEVLVVEALARFPRGSLRVVAPAAAEVVSGLLPGLVVGLGVDDGGAPALVVAAIDDEGGVGPAQLYPREGSRSAPGRLSLELRGLGPLVVDDATIALVGGDAPRLEVDGALRCDNLVDLMLASGAFEAEGARALLAERLGYTAETLPERVPTRATAEGRAD